MRRLAVVVALGALLGMFGGVVTAAPALARGPKWQFNAGQPFTVPADFCGFQIGVSFPVDKEYFKVLKAADGSMTLLVTGSLTLSNTNLSTGKTITANISGPGQITFLPDGSVITEETGRAVYALVPADAQRFGVPPVGLTAGPLTTLVDADGNLTSFSLQGHLPLSSPVPRSAGADAGSSNIRRGPSRSDGAGRQGKRQGDART